MLKDALAGMHVLLDFAKGAISVTLTRHYGQCEVAYAR